MTKSKKFKNLGDTAAEELKGFEDVLDLVLGSGTVHLKSSAKDSNFPNKIASYETQAYLEAEFLRLSVLDKLFSEKIPNLKDNPQAFNLLNKQRETRDQVKAEIVIKSLQEDSHFYDNICSIFNNAFKVTI